MARVYLARTTGPGGFARHVVIKAIPAERRDDEAFVAMFLDEARLVATLHHQHIAQVFEAGCADDGTYFLVMEYVHGETVRLVLQEAQNRRVKLPLELGLSVACAAAAGLHHAHERRDLDGTPLKIVHRDVSPSNLMLGFDGSIKLIDFGIAKATTRTTNTVTGFVKGKAGYMAPEQARGLPVDRRSDVFALGVLAYELTTQSRAFFAESQFEMMRRAMHGEIEPPSRRVAGYPPALEDVIMTALEVDPDDRFQDAEAMRVALEQIARELGLVLGDAPVIRALERLFPPRPEPWLIGAMPAGEDETAPLSTSSEPVIMVVGAARESGPPDPGPRTPTTVRLARGTDALPQRPETTSSAVPEPNAGIDTFDFTTQPFERTTPRHSQPSFGPLTPLPVQASAAPASTAAAASLATTASIASILPLPPARVTPLSVAPTFVLPEPAPVLPPTPVAPPAVVVSAEDARRPTENIVARTRGTWLAFGLAVIAAAAGGAVLASALEADLAGAPVAPDAAVAQGVEPPGPPAPAPPAPTTPEAPATASGMVMLTVTSSPDDSTVVLDGVRLGRTPFSAPVRSKHGLAWLKVRKRGYAAIKTRVSLEHDVRWEISLRKLSR